MTTLSQTDSAWHPVTVARATGTVVTARANGQSYRISLSVPTGTPPSGGYPCVVVLDGAALFATVAETERRLSNRPEVTGVEPTVIISVGHDSDGLYETGQRHRDYTPGPSTDPSVGGHAVGGAESFLGFLLKELLPLIGERVTLDASRRALLGHSMAGYFVLDTLVHHPSAFASYGSISPSVWWDPARIEEGLKSLTDYTPRLFLAVGELEQPREVSRRALRRMVDSVQQVAGTAEAAGLAEVVCLTLPDENHASVVAPAATRFLQFFSAAYTAAPEVPS